MSGATPPLFVEIVGGFAAAAAIAGVESRNENRPAEYRSKPRKSPAVIVTPLREVPGTIASA